MTPKTVAKPVTFEDLDAFLEKSDCVVIEDKKIRLNGAGLKKKLQPEEFKLETSTVWSFPKRGTWATHKANFRGNWAPQIARNIIERYSEPGDTVLDMMVGGGTTLVECVLTGRNGIGVDINRDALMVTLDRLKFVRDSDDERIREIHIRTYEGDARALDFVADESIDLIATHPPYANIIKYSKNNASHNAGDLSKLKKVGAFVEQIGVVADEAYRVLKPGKYCAILIGDTRINKHYVPIAYRVMDQFLKTGFILKEDIIKAQWNTQTETLWSKLSAKYNFLLILHEHLFIFRKPETGEKLKKYIYSMRSDTPEPGDNESQ
jgi:DNA modification methylase